MSPGRMMGFLTQRRKGAKTGALGTGCFTSLPFASPFASLRLCVKNSVPAFQMKRRVFQHGVVLLEAMIAVAVFSIGVLALGRCVENCIVAERIKVEDEHARRFLLNRMSEIEQGAIVMQDKATEELKGAFAGMSLRTTRVPLKKKNENKQELFGLFIVTLELSWKSGGQELSRDLTFYVYPQNR